MFKIVRSEKNIIKKLKYYLYKIDCFLFGIREDFLHKLWERKDNKRKMKKIKEIKRRIKRDKNFSRRSI